MRKHREILGSVFLELSLKRVAAGIAFVCIAGLAAAVPPASAQGTFTITSSDLRDGATVGNAQVYDQDDCKGGNVSPQLSWHHAPAGTKSFAVTIFDNDAPGPGWWHWAVAEIPPSVNALPSNASASGYLKKIGAIEARNDWGSVGYGGPCPPPGKPHRYIVTVFALNTANLRLGQARHALMFDHEINTTMLAKASLTVTYGR
ncbi:YbhB/YbcL family Raf kinase inhibitor-like protein [Trinickia acidisoli]|uniref:YbhB/YbcL family Raf kinase inhibitor-like protein n=1 Tax=Trinickia acidisoli TaxID=2767482 RepID=UPI001A900EF3|nr:YbhB/YbcL family Raf kinase inhibitor-like protein [Trinickia acidisoli]